MTTGNRQHGKIPNTCEKKLQRKHYLPHLKSTLAFKKVMIKFQLFPSCVRPSDVKKQRTTGHTVVRVDFRVWGQIVEGHYQYPHVISTFCFQRCTVWRVAGNTFFTYAWKGNRTASSDARVGVWVSFCTSEWLCGRNQKSTINYYDNPRWQKSSS